MFTSSVGLGKGHFFACCRRFYGLGQFFACPNPSDDVVLVVASGTLLGFTFIDEVYIMFTVINFRDACFCKAKQATFLTNLGCLALCQLHHLSNKSVNKIDNWLNMVSMKTSNGHAKVSQMLFS